MTTDKFSECKLQNGDGIFGKFKDDVGFHMNYRGELDLAKGTFSVFNFFTKKIETINISEIESLDKTS